MDPTGLYSSNLVTSALNTIGDAQFFEESISPSTVRTQLAVTGDPSNPSTTLNLLKGMKWLLANMSKGRNVSDFFPHVVKLVGAPNLEVRKMVYIYLARYANHDNSCRELALLSINAFQRGLADREPLLRSLALRVLTCMDVPDVLQLQVLGVRTCCKDSSPYVRKCAANAVGKLHPRCLEAGDGAQAEQLVDIITTLLEDDGSTMVLTSAMIAFCEICPHRLDLLHGCYRKVCHLLTDMDEWGQVVVMDAFAQYCRKFFKQPRGQVHGSAERIDRDRRITRSGRRVGGTGPPAGAGGEGAPSGGVAANETLLSLDGPSSTTADGPSAVPTLPPRQKQKVKRRVVRKGFYSDEEDESSVEEVDPYYPISGGNVARSLHESPVMGSPSGGANKLFFRDDMNASIDGIRPQDVFGWKGNGGAPAAALDDDTEDNDLNEDHKLLLQSSLPLLKSRNSAVVLAACSLHYYCGVASIKVSFILCATDVCLHEF
jgi:AP-3 complex subunit beta